VRDFFEVVAAVLCQQCRGVELVLASPDYPKSPFSYKSSATSAVPDWETIIVTFRRSRLVSPSQNNQIISLIAILQLNNLASSSLIIVQDKMTEEGKKKCFI
jgi:hypothetical protein